MTLSSGPLVTSTINLHFFLYFIVFICKLYKGQAKKYYNVTHKKKKKKDEKKEREKGGR